jgi:membrane fusion protein, multidrug efflux system
MSLIDEKTRPQAEAERQPIEDRQAPTQRGVAEALRPERPAAAPAEVATEWRRRPRRRRWLLIGLAALLIIAAIAGAADWWLRARNWVSTDDAFIDTHTVQVSAQVAGRVKTVLVNDNQEVRVGQPLVELDPADFQAALSQAQANEQSVAGTLAQANAQLPVDEANLDVAKAQVAAAQAALTNSDINLKRDQTLARMGGLAVSQQTIDNDTATWRTDTANLAAAQRRVVAAQAQSGFDEKNVLKAEAGVRSAAAQVEQARLNLSYTVIRASVNGRVTNKTVAVGDYVQVGQALSALVPDQVWVTANYKETEIGEMRIGDPVDIYVDAYPGHVFHGQVQSFQAGSGAAFSLLPPENATGNYIKVVQRVPVKIVFDGDPSAHWLLGPGMSVEPYVKIR